MICWSNLVCLENLYKKQICLSYRSAFISKDRDNAMLQTDNWMLDLKHTGYSIDK